MLADRMRMASGVRFPHIAAVAKTTNTSTVTLPAGITAGDILLMIVGHEDNGAVGTPSGWTSLFSTGSGSGRCQGFWKVASGAEGANVTLDESDISVVAVRITGAVDLECGTSVTGSDTAPNPPSLTASWGVKKTLWLAACGGRNDPTVSGMPAGFTEVDQIDDDHGDVGSFACIAELESAEATVNPAAFTLSTSASWVAQTIAVEPG